MKTQTYLLLIVAAYVVGIAVGLLLHLKVIFLLVLIPTTYVFWKGHKAQQKMDKLFKDIEDKIKTNGEL